jgi:type IV pilus assembly protein PilB
VDNERSANAPSQGTAGAGPSGPPALPAFGGAPAVNRTSMLVADLIAATGLVSPDRLALARSAAGAGSLARALADKHPAPAPSPVEPAPASGLEDDEEVAAPAVDRLVDSLIVRAAEDGASDIHLEPQADELLVRIRIDGVLQEARRFPKRTGNEVITRLKELAGLELEDERTPQHGRIALDARGGGRRLDVRIATLPTVEGESIVLRLLDRSKRAPKLEELGMSEEMTAQLEALLSGPSTALIVTGPAASGTSTTLYALLAEINRPEINVVAVEDTVEHQLPGIKQVQIDEQAGFTYPVALESILRSDPDVLMIGEIREGESARIAIEAALSGHFVLATLHAGDAPQALGRLADLGVEPFLIGSAVSAVLAQRLARRLCSHCCEMYSPSVEELIKARVSPEVAAASDGMVFYRRKGCPRCHQTGFKGRVGIYQLLAVGARLEAIGAASPTREEIERAVIGEGVRTMWDDGLAKVAAGLTSIEELVRVLA